MSRSFPPKGRVQKYHANFYYVDLQGRLFECQVRGLLKKEGTDVLVGDLVELDSVDEANQTARIVSVLERKSVIQRPKMANVDQAVVVYSLYEPDFDPKLADRYLTHIELAGMIPILCISKADLAKTPEELETIREMYQEKLGFSVIFTSIFQEEGLQRFLELAHGKVSVLAGPSGAGKSSLLNAIRPDFNLRVGDVSEKIARGQHTTRHVELLPVAEETFVADTPGFSYLKFNTILPQELEAIYRDFEPYRAQCAFSDCLHVDEEGCAVKAHWEHIIPSRYESYRDMLTEALLYKEQSQQSSGKEEYGYKTVSRKGKKDLQILRLKEKARESSRRTQKQQVNHLLDQVDLDEGSMDEHPETS